MTKPKRKIALMPPSLKSDKGLEDFLSEPDNVKDPKPKKAVYPWQAPGVTDEIVKSYLLRLTKPDKLKAEFIIKQSLGYKSLQDFFTTAILNQIGKDLKKLGID